MLLRTGSHPFLSRAHTSPFYFILSCVPKIPQELFAFYIIRYSHYIIGFTSLHALYMIINKPIKKGGERESFPRLPHIENGYPLPPMTDCCLEARKLLELLRHFFPLGHTRTINQFLNFTMHLAREKLCQQPWVNRNSEGIDSAYACATTTRYSVNRIPYLPSRTVSTQYSKPLI